MKHLSYQERCFLCFIISIAFTDYIGRSEGILNIFPSNLDRFSIYRVTKSICIELQEEQIVISCYNRNSHIKNERDKISFFVWIVIT